MKMWKFFDLEDVVLCMAHMFDDSMSGCGRHEQE